MTDISLPSPLWLLISSSRTRKTFIWCWHFPYVIVRFSDISVINSWYTFGRPRINPNSHTPISNATMKNALFCYLPHWILSVSRLTLYFFIFGFSQPNSEIYRLIDKLHRLKSAEINFKGRNISWDFEFWGPTVHRTTYVSLCQTSKWNEGSTIDM